MAFLFKDLFAPSKSRAEKIYGKKPVYGTTQEAAAEALRANQANLPEAEKLAGNVNEFNQEQMLKMLRASIPGYDAIVGQQSNILQSELKGEIPADVQKQLQLSAASRAVSGGYAGSGVHQNLEARNFGLTSFDITNRALDSASRWTQGVAQLTQPATFNVASAFVPFETQLGWNKQIAEGIAAPSPSVRGSFDSQLAFAGMLTSGYAGGQGYNQAYRPPSQQPTPPEPTPQYIPQWNTVSGPAGNSSPGYGSGGPFE